MSINVLIADDHQIVREGIKQILSESKKYTPVALVSNGNEVLNVLKNQKIDLIIMDISMPEMNGLDTVKIIKQNYPKIPVLILSIHPEERYGARIIKAGASGYLTKDSLSNELLNALDTIFGGEKYIKPSLLKEIVNLLERDAILPHNLLSDREYEVMVLLARGISVKEIAQKLFVSIPTVGTYRMRIYEKMKMKSISELTYYALTNNLID